MRSPFCFSLDPFQICKHFTLFQTADFLSPVDRIIFLLIKVNPVFRLCIHFQLRGWIAAPGYRFLQGNSLVWSEILVFADCTRMFTEIPGARPEQECLISRVINSFVCFLHDSSVMIEASRLYKEKQTDEGCAIRWHKVEFTVKPLFKLLSKFVTLLYFRGYCCVVNPEKRLCDIRGSTSILECRHFLHYWKIKNLKLMKIILYIGQHYIIMQLCPNDPLILWVADVCVSARSSWLLTASTSGASNVTA